MANDKIFATGTKEEGGKYTFSAFLEHLIVSLRNGFPGLVGLF